MTSMPHDHPAAPVGSPPSAAPTGPFAPAGPGSTYVRCTACGATGRESSSWGDAHRRPHVPCRDCGKPLAATRQGGARGHFGCPARRSSMRPGQVWS